MSSPKQSCCSAISQRWVFAVIASLGSVNTFTMRICLSLAITEMVAPAETRSNGTNSSATNSTSPRASSGRTYYEWDEYTQGLILSSFFWGLVISQIPSIYFVKKFGPKWVDGLSRLSTAIFTLLTPAVIKAYGATGLIVLRAIMGFGEAGVIPASYDLLARWAPPEERSKIATLVMSGMQVGTILGTALSGVLIKYSSIGWPMAFYVFGVIGVLWFLAFAVLCYNSPDEHPFITQKEKDYMNEAMRKHTHKEAQPFPWRHILTSVPAWAFLAGRIGQEWIFQVMIIDLPKYMSNVLKFSIEANGFLLALPNAMMWLFSIVFSWFADWLIKTNTLSRTATRKILFTISTIGPAVLIIAASYAEYDYVMVVVLFTGSMGMMGACYSGIMVNCLDLAPNHCGTLTSISSVISSLCGFLVPYTIGILTPNQGLLEWRIVFWITFIVLCVACLIFNTWGNAEVQYWNNLKFFGANYNDIERTEKLSFLKNTTETVKKL